MSLKKYRQKRDLQHSPEPQAKRATKQTKNLHFVIQKHDASRLHYDFRLELDGVLKSWAIPKGPSLDPKDKRLAIMVEDHPYDYKDFEGIIPKGYGKGTVMIWDEGTYDVEGRSLQESQKLIHHGLAKGELHFTLHGKKIHGEFSLIRFKNESGKSQWLLIKKKDAFSSKKNVCKQDRSVVSNRSLKEIEQGITQDLPKVRMPHLIKPMYATLIDEPFDNPDWLFEIKWDGFRAIAEVNGSKVDLYSRYLQSFNERFFPIVDALKQLAVQAIFDGEIVVLDKKGKPSFQDLQNLQKKPLKNKALYFCIFDLLYLNGCDLTSLPLIERKQILQQLLCSAPPHIRYTDHIENSGVEFFKAAIKNGLEGIIGKLKDSTYKTGKRAKEWVKIKGLQRQEAIICGYTEPKGSRKNIGALVLGIYKDNTLQFVGHCGGGLDEVTLQDLKKVLHPLEQKKSPFKITPKTNTAVTWVKPHYLCEVSFSEWTKEGRMRQPIFLGLREDKPAKQVVKEKPIKTKKILQKIPKDPPSFKLKKKLELTHLDKIFWPEENITKGDLINYYYSISKYILPYLKDRPESLRRNPHGITKPSFFQKDLEYYPEWIHTQPIKHENKTVNYLLIQDVESLLFAVNLGCIEINPLLSRMDSLNFPDFLVLDLDPEGIAFESVIEVANAIYEILQQLNISGYCKTSGATGMHICIPLKAKYSYEQSKQFAQLIAMVVHQRLPKITSLERSPKKRAHRVYIDYLQNNFGQTITAPYSVRPKPLAPVSTPLDWAEVKPGLSPTDFTIKNMLQRLEKKGDLFKPVLGKGIHLEKALKKLEKLL